MKVKSTSIFLGDNTLRARHTDEKLTEAKGKRKSIDASKLNMKLDPIAEKKKEAQRKAMKIVGDAFGGECKVDDDMKERNDRIHSLQDEMTKTVASMDALDEKKAKLLEEYGDENSLEYQTAAKELSEMKGALMKNLRDARRDISVESSIISATSLERLKSHPILDATKEADAILEASSKDVMNMLVDEAKDKMAEKEEEEKTEAKKEAEKRKEIEEKLEASKEKKKEQEEFTEDILEKVSEALETKNSVTDAKDKVDEMLNKMALIAEDIKGAKVDEML